MLKSPLPQTTRFPLTTRVPVQLPGAVTHNVWPTATVTEPPDSPVMVHSGLVFAGAATGLGVGVMASHFGSLAGSVVLVKPPTWLMVFPIPHTFAQWM